MPVDKAWLLRALKLIAESSSSFEELEKYVIELQGILSSSKSQSPQQEQVCLTLLRKTARALLKKRSTSVPLYNAYGLTELRFGDAKLADNVFASAIKMSETLPDQARQDVLLLLLTWTWDALRKGNNSTAVQRILLLTDEHALEPSPLEAQAVSPSAVLRTGNHLRDLQHRYITSHPPHFVRATQLLSMLAYLTSASLSQLSLEAALSSISSSLALLRIHHEATSEAAELVHRFRGELLQHHVQASRLYMPATVRTVLTESIRLFPSNAFFLRLYMENEARFRIDDRVRNILQTVVLAHDGRDNRRDDNMVGLVFAIDNEIRRVSLGGSETGSTSHAVRAAFEKGVAHGAGGAHNPALWTRFLNWELASLHNSGQQKHSRALKPQMERVKMVFYRGLTALPWCKHFVMHAFEDGLSELMSAEEKRRVYDVLLERELRLHVELPVKLLASISSAST